VISVACQCDEGFGRSHTHLFHWEKRDGVMQSTYGPDDGISMWVNWKAVARGVVAS
jgi:hypothetical protein